MADDKTKDPVEGELTKGVIVVSSGQPGGRRRAGRDFGPEPVKIDLKDLKKGELAALESDPLLSTKRIALIPLERRGPLSPASDGSG